MGKLSSVLFYIVAAWCTVVGIVNQTLSSVDDLPWVAQALAGVDVTPFEPIFAIWAHWIWMFLIIAGASLFLIIPTIHESRRMLLAATVLSAGTIGAQAYSVLSLGAFGPPVIALSTALVLAILAPTIGWILTIKARTDDA